MESFKLVLPENLNHFGYLFGGYLLKWVDEYAWIAATLEYPDCRFVTIAMDQVEFRRSVQGGVILRFQITNRHVGRTSVSYQVNVTSGNESARAGESIFATTVTLVRVDDQGNKLPL
jgi:acyl-CoA hydrolase